MALTGIHHNCRVGLAALSVVFCVAIVDDARGDDIPIVNAGFEDISGQSPVNEFTFGAPNGWSLYDPGGITSNGDGPTFYVGTLTPFETDPIGNPGVYTNFPDGAAEGERVAIAFNFEGSGGTGEYGIVQALAEVLEANAHYVLEVEIGNIASGTAMSGQFFDLDGFPGYRVDLLAGDVVIAQDANSLAGAIPEGTFATSTVELTTSADHPQIGEPLAIRLVNLNLIDPEHPDADLEVDFDDVRLTAEPACDADVDGDGAVALSDLLAVIGCWGSAAAGDCADADIDGSGTTDLGDLLAVIGNWGCGNARVRATRTR